MSDDDDQLEGLKEQLDKLLMEWEWHQSHRHTNANLRQRIDQIWQQRSSKGQTVTLTGYWPYKNPPEGGQVTLTGSATAAVTTVTSVNYGPVMAKLRDEDPAVQYVLTKNQIPPQQLGYEKPEGADDETFGSFVQHFSEFLLQANEKQQNQNLKREEIHAPWIWRAIVALVIGLAGGAGLMKYLGSLT